MGAQSAETFSSMFYDVRFKSKCNERALLTSQNSFIFPVSYRYIITVDGVKPGQGALFIEPISSLLQAEMH